MIYFWSIWDHYTMFSYIFSGGCCTPFIESCHERVWSTGSEYLKRLWIFRFFDWFSKVKTEECDLRVWNVDITILFQQWKFLRNPHVLLRYIFFIFCRTKCGRFTKSSHQKFYSIIGRWFLILPTIVVLLVLY